MFVRFRQVRCRLQCSLIETRRVDGRARHEHIASLGTIEIPPSIADRVAFWNALHQRLGKLSNRFSHEMHGKLIGQIHARIPMPTADEQRQLQKENAEADEWLWSSLQDMNASMAADHKELAAAADAAANADRAKERLAKIERGEDVPGGLGKPVDLEAVLLNAGFTKRDLERFRRASDFHDELERLGLEDEFRKAFHQRYEANIRRAEREAERDVLRKRALARH
jgi:hypothetical protein